MTRVSGTAPQIRMKTSTFHRMMEVFICLCLLLVCSAIFYGLYGGGNNNYPKSTYVLFVFLNAFIAIAFSMIPDVLWNLPVLFRKDMKGKDRAKEYGYRIVHSYSYVSGILLALLLPIGPEWWEIALTAFLSTFVMKLLFGGFGFNIFNPAIFGRVFAQIAFGSHLTTYLGNLSGSLDITTGATLPGLVKIGGIGSLNSLPLYQMLIGTYYGTLGETFILVIFVIGVYLALRHIIDWRVPVLYIGSLYIAALILFLALGQKGQSFEDALRYVMMGGIFFGAVFCLTDPVTTPTSTAGRVIFALGAAFFTLILRLYTSSPEGVAYSILLMNAMTPLIDKVLTGRTNKVKVPYILAGSLLLMILAIGLSYGLTHSALGATSALTGGLSL
jgi:Na+-translocating ferredoxin:NAD+ oxidoreductase subunit D